MRRVLVAHGQAHTPASAKSEIGTRKTEIRVGVLAAILNDERAVLEAARQSGLSPDVVRRALRALAQSA